MNAIDEGIDYVTMKVDQNELVGLYGSVFTALTFHEHELFALTALTPDEARTLLAELAPVVDRMREARKQRGLPW